MKFQVVFYFQLFSDSVDPPLKAIATPSLCSDTTAVYNILGDYRKTSCLISDNLNYTDARLNCLKNEMHLFELDDYSESKTTLLAYANKKWTPKSGNVMHTKGRKYLNCANINNTAGDFVDGFGSCSLTTNSFCQFLDVARE